MAKLSDFVIAFIIVLATATVLITFAGEFTASYGVSTTVLYNDTGGLCGSQNTVIAIKNINSLFQNQTVDATTYAPGQKNAPVGSSIATATQASGLIVTLKAAFAPITLGKAMVTDLGCAAGVPETFITAFEVIFIFMLLILIAGLFYFRPI